MFNKFLVRLITSLETPAIENKCTSSKYSKLEMTSIKSSIASSIFTIKLSELFCFVIFAI